MSAKNEPNKPDDFNANEVDVPRLVRLPVDRPWRDYPEGTKAHAVNGGRWVKTFRGWKWNGPEGNGGTFPTPGGDACGNCIELPEPNDESSHRLADKPNTVE